MTDTHQELKNPTVNFRWVKMHQVNYPNPRVGDLLDDADNNQYVITFDDEGGWLEISRLYPHERATQDELKGRVEVCWNIQT